MNTPARLHRAAVIVFAAGVWILTASAVGGHASEPAAAALALAGAVIVGSRGGLWTTLGIGVSLAAGSVLTIGSASAPVTLLVNVTGIVLVTAAGWRLAIGLLRDGDAAVRPVLVGVLGFLVADFAVVQDTAMGSFSALALVLPAAALLPLAYAALISQPAPATARATAPRSAAATTR